MVVLRGRQTLEPAEAGATEPAEAEAAETTAQETTAPAEAEAAETTAPEPTAPATLDRSVALFCAEYALHPALRIYSGGLGVLAGDICKEASDLGVPMVAVGLLYRQGFFQQRVDLWGRQHEYWVPLDPATLPIVRVADAGGRPLAVTVRLRGRPVACRIWRTDVGRVPLYLLDTELDVKVGAATVALQHLMPERVVLGAEGHGEEPAQHATNVIPAGGADRGTVVETGPIHRRQVRPFAGLQRAGLPANAAIYVGDNYYSDVLGPRRAGLRPVLYDPRGVFPDPDCESIKSFDELNSLLRNI